MNEFNAAWDILKRYSDDRMGRLHRELLRQNQFRQGAVDTSQMTRDDRVRLHNKRVLPGGKLVDSGYHPIPPRSYVPVAHIEESGKGNTHTTPRLSYGEENLYQPFGRYGGSYPHYASPGDFRVEDREQYESYRDEQEAMDLPKIPGLYRQPRPAVRDSATDPLGIDKALVKAVLEKKDSKPFHGYNPNRHSREGGLNAKGRAKFKRETGANLKPPVTEKPSTLKPGSKKAKRRKSFCARMSGVKGPTSKGGKLTPKGAALKRWNC